jgi:hypothetical protein|tara:strand:+ start:642 stop:785 length:144 start_codon:yes stop_codon:yes gene_type:complete
MSTLRDAISPALPARSLIAAVAMAVRGHRQLNAAKKRGKEGKVTQKE